jgi:hypothetical protein
VQGSARNDILIQRSQKAPDGLDIIILAKCQHLKIDKTTLWCILRDVATSLNPCERKAGAQIRLYNMKGEENGSLRFNDEAEIGSAL